MTITIRFLGSPRAQCLAAASAMNFLGRPLMVAFVSGSFSDSPGPPGAMGFGPPSALGRAWT